MFPSLSYNPLYLSIQNPCHFFLSWANTELVFIVVSIFTSFLWCHVCSLPALLYVFLCWESWAFVGPRLNILWLESPSITTVVSLGRPNCSDLEIEGGKRKLKGTWQGLGAWKHCIGKFSPQKCTTRTRKRLDIYSGNLKWETYFGYSRFTASLVKGMLTILLVLSSWEKKACGKIFTVKRSHALTIEL